MLDEANRQLLFAIARESIERAFDGLPIVDRTGLPQALLNPAGAFVTLTIRGELRGCIGTIVPVSALHRAVAENARHAAFSDPRFSPLERGEYPDLHIEISIMGPITRVSDPSDIVVGRDGLIVALGGRKGLLLPQVATEYGWDRETFLDHTCRKAGLPPGSWQMPGVTIEKFSAEVFGEVAVSK